MIWGFLFIWLPIQTTISKIDLKPLLMFYIVKNQSIFHTFYNVY